MAAAVPPAGHHGELLITQTHADVTRDVVGTLSPAGRGYLMLLFGAVGMFLVGAVTFLILVMDGLGHAGYQPPIFWSVFITTFVFWIGIGHAGTLISAILFLFRSPWRTLTLRPSHPPCGANDQFWSTRIVAIARTSFGDAYSGMSSGTNAAQGPPPKTSGSDNKPTICSAAAAVRAVNSEHTIRSEIRFTTGSSPASFIALPDTRDSLAR